MGDDVVQFPGDPRAFGRTHGLGDVPVPLGFQDPVRAQP
jgi:hypothetical protein